MSVPIKAKEFLPIVEAMSNSYKIDYKMLCGICEVESSWNPYAVRYESDFKDLSQPFYWAKHLGITEMTEIQCQKTYWGLCQMMGSVARGLGFEDMLPKLCDANMNLHFMCSLLTRLKAKYPLPQDQICAYNMGHVEKSLGKYVNQDYVDKVLKAMGNY